MAHSIAPDSLRSELKKVGYSDKMIEELWKWYDPEGKRGVASF